MTWVVTAKTRFYLHDDESLLDGLLRTGHQVDFQCKEGYCGSCRLHFSHSSQPIEYDNPPIAMIDADEVLACCCRVSGLIQLDDVQ